MTTSTSSKAIHDKVGIEVPPECFHNLNRDGLRVPTMSTVFFENARHLYDKTNVRCRFYCTILLMHF